MLEKSKMKKPPLAVFLFVCSLNPVKEAEVEIFDEGDYFRQKRKNDDKQEKSNWTHFLLEFHFN